MGGGRDDDIGAGEARGKGASDRGEIGRWRLIAALWVWGGALWAGGEGGK